VYKILNVRKVPLLKEVLTKVIRRFTILNDYKAKSNIYEVREKTNKMQQLEVYYQYSLNMFRASLCPSPGEQDLCYCMWCAVLVLLDVVGGALRCRVRAL